MTRSDLLKSRLDRFVRMLHGVEHGDIRALHRARVASRRLRELLPVLQLESDVTRKLGRRLREVTGRLGIVRELDVLLLLIDELHVSSRDQAAALDRVRGSLINERDAARRRLLGHLPVAEMRKIARKLGRIVDELADADRATSRRTGPGATTEWSIDARIAVRASRLLSAIDAAGAVYLPERLHDVRIALKKLRYAVELSSDATTRTLRADLGALKRAQAVLGRMHDVQVLIDRVREMQASISPPQRAAWAELDALVLTLDDDCRRLHARYMRVRERLVVIATRLRARGSTRGHRPRQSAAAASAARRAS